MPATIHHALVLNLHQPWGNLDQMLGDAVEQERWHGKECLFAYDRIPRAVWGWEDVRGSVRLRQPALPQWHLPAGSG